MPANLNQHPVARNLSFTLGRGLTLSIGIRSSVIPPEGTSPELVTLGEKQPFSSLHRPCCPPTPGISSLFTPPYERAAHLYQIFETVESESSPYYKHLSNEVSLY